MSQKLNGVVLLFEQFIESCIMMLMTEHMINVKVMVLMICVAINAIYTRGVCKKIKSYHKSICIKPKVWLFGLSAKASFVDAKALLGKGVVLVELAKDSLLPIGGTES